MVRSNMHIKFVIYMSSFMWVTCVNYQCSPAWIFVLLKELLQGCLACSILWFVSMERRNMEMNVESAQQNNIFTEKHIWYWKITSFAWKDHGTHLKLYDSTMPTQLVGRMMLKVLHCVSCSIVAKLIQTTEQQGITWRKCSMTIRIVWAYHCHLKFSY